MAHVTDVRQQGKTRAANFAAKQRANATPKFKSEGKSTKIPKDISDKNSRFKNLEFKDTPVDEYKSNLEDAYGSKFKPSKSGEVEFLDTPDGNRFTYRIKSSTWEHGPTIDFLKEGKKIMELRFYWNK